jgi:hypothetical protein
MGTADDHPMTTCHDTNCSCHCARCRTPNLAAHGQVPKGWEPLVDDHLNARGALCPACVGADPSSWAGELMALEPMGIAF